VQHRWDLACDYAINPLLIDAGIETPPGALHIPMYPYKDTSRTLDKHAYDPDNQGRGSDSGLREGDLPDRSLAAGL